MAWCLNLWPEAFYRYIDWSSGLTSNFLTYSTSTQHDSSCFNCLSLIEDSYITQNVDQIINTYQLVSLSKSEIQQFLPFWWWQPIDDGVKLDSRSLNKLPLSICHIDRTLNSNWIQVIANLQHVNMNLCINLCITCHVINILSSTYFSPFVINKKEKYHNQVFVILVQHIAWKTYYQVLSSCSFEAKKFSKCYIMLRTFKLSSFRYASFTAYKIALLEHVS